jgi:hypothetical protein
VTTLDFPARGPQTVVWSSDGRFLFYVAVHATLRVFDRRTGRSVPLDLPTTDVTAIASRPASPAITTS